MTSAMVFMMINSLFALMMQVPVWSKKAEFSGACEIRLP